MPEPVTSEQLAAGLNALGFSALTLDVKPTVPVGAAVWPDCVSVTVARQVVAVVAGSVNGVHATVVEVEKPLTVKVCPYAVELA